VAQEGGPQAAIGSARAAELYDLPVIAAGIENDPGNVTRFIVVAKDAAPADGPGPFKTTLVFHGAGDDSPGWLVDCLSEFATRAINLTKIESRPQRGRIGHYLFVIDLEGSERDEPVREAVAGLRTRCESVRLLGTYRPG
jgi:prephenate dehydratase